MPFLTCSCCGKKKFVCAECADAGGGREPKVSKKMEPVKITDKIVKEAKVTPALGIRIKEILKKTGKSRYLAKKQALKEQAEGMLNEDFDDEPPETEAEEQEIDEEDPDE